MTMLSNITVSARALAPPTTALERLASGRRLNRFDDDPAGFALAESLDATVRSGSVAARNISDALAATQQLEASLDAMAERLVRMREVAMQALNDVWKTEERVDELLGEFWGQRRELNRIARTTKVNLGMDRSLADGFTLLFGVGTDGSPDSVIELTVPSVWAGSIVDPDSGTRLSAAWIGIPSFARTALHTIDAGLDTINRTRSTIGAFQNRLEHAFIINDARTHELAGAHSTVADADLAGETVRVIRGLLARESGVGLAAVVRDLDVAAVRQLLA